jgi:hypothetical protein
MRKSFVFLVLSFMLLFVNSTISCYWGTGWTEFKQPEEISHE